MSGEAENLIPYGTPISSRRCCSSNDAPYAFDGLINTNFRSAAAGPDCYIGMDFGADALGPLALLAPLMTSEPCVFKSVLTYSCLINVQELVGRP